MRNSGLSLIQHMPVSFLDIFYIVFVFGGVLFLTFYFLILLSTLPSAGNSHVQWTVKETICILILKYIHAHLHTQAYMHL